MTNPYSSIRTIWDNHSPGDPANTADAISLVLSRQEIRFRQDDGILKKMTISKPISVPFSFVIGLRYDKRDGTQTEDHFFIEKGHPVKSHYRGSLERYFPEYQGTHKQKVDYSLVGDVHLPLTMTNTICVLTKNSFGQNALPVTHLGGTMARKVKK